MSDPRYPPQPGAPAPQPEITEEQFMQMSDQELMALTQSVAEPEIDRETQHGEISWKDRLVVKNFANSPDAMKKYLQKEHPELQVETYDNNIIVRNKAKGEKQYKVLDPEGFQWGDIAADIGDIGYDVAAGIGTSAATAGGAALTGPAALVGGAAAGGAASAGLEALRQKIGQGMGIEQEMDMGQIKGAGIGGAVSPLLFGVGGKVGQAALKSGQKLAGKGVVGIAGEAVGKLPGFAAKFASGKSMSAIKEAEKHLDDIVHWNKNPQAYTEFVEELGERAHKGLMDHTTKMGRKLQESVRPIKNVDLEDEVMDLASRLTRLGDDLPDNELSQEFMQDLVEDLSGSIPKNYRNMPGIELFNLKKQLANKAALAKTGKWSPEKLNSLGIDEKMYISLFKDLGDKVNKKLVSAASKHKVPTAELKSGMKDYFKLLSDSRVNFADPNTTLQTLKRASRRGQGYLNQKLAQVDSKAKLGIMEGAEKLRAFDALGDPNVTGIQPSAVKGGILKTLGGFGGYGLGSVMGGGAPMLGAAGAGLGMVAADIVQNPNVIRRGLEVAAKLRSIPGYKPTAAEANILWNLMRSREGQVR